MKPAIPVYSSLVLASGERTEEAPKVTRSYLPITKISHQNLSIWERNSKHSSVKEEARTLEAELGVGEGWKRENAGKGK